MNWFKRRGFLFFPVHPVGWVIFTGVVAYLVYAFLDINKTSESISETLMSWSFNALVAFVIYSVIAFFTSPKKTQ